MKLNALERSADKKLTELIQAELKKRKGAPVGIDTFARDIRKQSGDELKVLANAHHEAQIRIKLRRLTKVPPSFNEMQLELFPDLKFIPQMLVYIDGGESTLIEITAASLAQYDQWMECQVQRNRRAVDAQEARYANFRDQISPLTELYGSDLTIGELMALAQADRQTKTGNA
jgi:hypothetical protein